MVSKADDNERVIRPGLRRAESYSGSMLRSRDAQGVRLSLPTHDRREPAVFYSSCNARIGSIREARLAGREPETAAVAHTTTAVTTIVTPS
jgi:hypothetical protein